MRLWVSFPIGISWFSSAPRTSLDERLQHFIRTILSKTFAHEMSSANTAMWSARYSVQALLRNPLKTLSNGFQFFEVRKPWVRIWARAQAIMITAFVLFFSSLIQMPKIGFGSFCIFTISFPIRLYIFNTTWAMQLRMDSEITCE